MPRHNLVKNYSSMKSVMRGKNLFPCLFLALVILAALILRLAGLGYDSLSAGNHDEQIHLRTALAFASGELNPRVLWEKSVFRYVYYPWLSAYIFAAVISLADLLLSLGAFLANLWIRLSGLRLPGGELAGPVGFPRLSPAAALYLGRSTVAVFGALTVSLIWRAGRRFMGAGGALLGAAFLALNGSHIANCHWMKNDVIAAFFLTAAFLFCLRVREQGRISDYLWGSALCVLAFNVKWYNAPVFGVFLLAHVLRVFPPGSRFSPGRLFPGRFLGAILLGAALLALTWPVILLDGDFVVSNLSRIIRDTSSRGMFGSVGAQARLGFWSIRFHNALNFLRFSSGLVSGMGVPVLILGAGGLVYCLLSRKRNLLLLAAFPVLYLVSAVLAASPGIRYQDTIPLYPFFSLAAALALVRAGEMLTKRRRSGLVAYPVGLFLLGIYLFSAVRMSYGYWQNSVSFFSGAWARRNLPPGSLIVRESKAIDLPPGRFREHRVRSLWRQSVERLAEAGVDYVVVSGRQERRATERFGLFGPDHPFARIYRTLPEKYDLIKEFDLGEIPYRGGTADVWARRRDNRLVPAGIDSGWLRVFQGEHSSDCPDILFLDPAGRCQGDTSFTVPAGESRDRLLVTSTPLKEIAVGVENGPREGYVKVICSGRRVREKLAPGETRVLVFPAREGFPWIRRSYRVQAASAWDSSCRVSILTDPLRIGRALLRAGDPRAQGYLDEAASLWANDWYVLSLAGRDLPPGTGLLLGKLAGALERPDWREAFLDLTGFSSEWLEERAGAPRGLFPEPEGAYILEAGSGAAEALVCPSLRSWLTRELCPPAPTLEGKLP